jgi:hypothetical protein
VSKGVRDVFVPSPYEYDVGDVRILVEIDALDVRAASHNAFREEETERQISIGSRRPHDY